MKIAARPTATAARASIRHEFALTARAVALPARLLHRMRRVEHNRDAGLRHNRKRAHVGDKRVVAEAHAALAQHILSLPVAWRSS
jgi:hypothetical protein